ncbi:hypothetical protein [Myxococcus sp. RHSTA-1-4]|uniref:hypothetical protein n=1 Tax=Myxococcus sp. RHSTA-1-4 TaxID=2874601 RepID=UPI001CBF16B3|nr:hypothetical protein [Myxococcus sp. RHSTA-1-4]MBZ4415835.1 hypothetical protein [Myxococcus sp. RHSTA-1-4]
MRSWLILCVSLVGLLGCEGGAVSVEEPRQTVSPEATLNGVTWVGGDTGGGDTAGRAALRFAEREPLMGDLAHYRIPVRVGAGEHDVVTLHRVVRERAPGRPSRTSRAVFMVHGDGWGFEAAFLSSVGSAHVPADRSLGVFLAQEGVDVWGIDLRWVGVPAGTQDFSFMKDWTLGTHAADVGTGLRLARVVRAMTGSARGSMHLLGWSRGAAIGYAYLNQETRLPRGLRQVDGFIPVDMVVQYAPDEVERRAEACERHAVLNADRAEGRVEGGLLGPAPGIMLQAIGQAATLAPDAPSELVPDDVFGPGTGRPTNRRVAIVSAAATGALLAPLKAITPGYHLMGGTLDATGLPAGLAFISHEGYLYEYAQRSAPYQSLNEVVETEAWLCGLEVPYDDHLSEVKVPVLYVGAAGGMGRYGEHSVSLLGSQDVTVLTARTLPEEYRALDYGHADLFLADDARERVWTPLLQWVRAH